MAIKLENLRAGVLPACSRYLHKCGQNVLEDAKNKCPVRTGALRDSLHISEETPTKVVIADGVEYGVYVTLGTRYQEANPFMQHSLLNKNNYQNT